MSYENMDHAEWAQSNITAAKTRAGSKRPRKGLANAPDHLSEFQIKVMDILGMVGNGIYNAPIAWGAIDWDYGRGVAVPWRNDMATFDFYQLTALVFLCHEARIRVQISPHNNRHLLLSFWQRKATGGMGERHPNLDEAIAAFREYLPADHRIIYKPQPEPHAQSDAPARLIK